jgi:hypothetical protein
MSKLCLAKVMSKLVNLYSVSNPTELRSGPNECYKTFLVRNLWIFCNKLEHLSLVNFSSLD